MLAVAKMPIEALDTTWTVGRNRPLDQKYVRKFVETFCQMGLERHAEENRLWLLYSAEQVKQAQTVQETASDGMAFFPIWAQINDKAEVMAGQHRI